MRRQQADGLSGLACHGTPMCAKGRTESRDDVPYVSAFLPGRDGAARGLLRRLTDNGKVRENLYRRRCDDDAHRCELRRLVQRRQVGRAVGRSNTLFKNCYPRRSVKVASFACENFGRRARGLSLPLHCRTHASRSAQRRDRGAVKSTRPGGTGQIGCRGALECSKKVWQSPGLDVSAPAPARTLPTRYRTPEPPAIRHVM